MWATRGDGAKRHARPRTDGDEARRADPPGATTSRRRLLKQAAVGVAVAWNSLPTAP
ncbi:MAG: twin-arginine translocation signal domain-containing protein [Acidimicrobiia bacterium]|nr:twin-arginine translocation signal domain-containing protein [Acidimicrobiia bacterium]